MKKRSVSIAIVIGLILLIILVGQLTNFAIKFLGPTDVTVMDLKNFPDIFIDPNGAMNFYFAYDFTAKNAVEAIKNSLFNEAQECFELTKPKRGNEKSESIKLTDTLQSKFGSTLDSGDVDGFFDGEVHLDINGVDNVYSARDELRMASASSLAPQTGLTYEASDDWADKVFVPLEKGSISYFFVFDSNLKQGNFITDATQNDPAIIPFLGQELKIEAATSTSITTFGGNRLWMKAGEKVVSDGKEIELIQTNPSKATVSVGGVMDVIETGRSKWISGIEVYLDQVSDESGIEYDSALMVMGTEARVTIKDGDPFFGDDKNDPLWIWELTALNTNNPKIGIEFNLNINRPDLDYPGISHPLYEGEKLCLPYEYACLELNEIQSDDFLNYEIRDSSASLYESETAADPSVSNANVISIKSKGGDGFRIGDYSTDEIFLYSTGSSLKVYRKAAGKTNLVQEISSNTNDVLKLNWGNTNLPINLEWSASNDNGNIIIDNSVGSDVKVFIEATGDNKDQFTYLGTEEGDTTTTNDILYGSKDISNFKEDTRTASGIVIRDPKSRTSSDRFEMSVPGTADNFKVGIAIVKSAELIKPKDVGCRFSAANFVDTREIKDLTGQNLIILGNDKLANDYMNAEVAEYYKNNRGIVVLVNNGRNTALLVLGKDSFGIEQAGEVIANMHKYKLSGDIYVVE